MANEVLDGGKGKKGRKTLRGVYSEEAGNVLKAKTPEEEYIANREAEIKKVKNKIEENKKAVKEVENKLPGQEEKTEMEKKVIEEFSINRLSEFLSDDELETIKKGREYSELHEIIEDGIVDPLEDLINKIFEGIKDLSDEEKFIIAKYLGNKQIIYVDMRQHQCEFGGGHDCRVGFYYTDFPEKSDFVREVRKNLLKLGLDKYIKFTGDCCYELDNQLVCDLWEEFRKQSVSDVEKENESEAARLWNEGEKLERKLKSLEEGKEAVEQYGLPEKEAISLYRWSGNLEGINDEFYDKKNHMLVVLHGYSDYNGGGGYEYGSVISIKRGKNKTKKRFKYRDRYDYMNDNPRYEYRKIKSVKVDGDRVDVTVSSGKSTDTYNFDIAYKEDKKSLSSVKKNKESKKSLSFIEKKEFEEFIRKIEEELIVENTKDQKYLASYNFSLREVPGAFSRLSEDGMGYGLESELPYDNAKVVYEKIMPGKGEAHVTILMQKDASGDMGRQFGLIKYIVTPEGAQKVDDYFYWELNQIEGNVDEKKIKKFMKW